MLINKLALVCFLIACCSAAIHTSSNALAQPIRIANSHQPNEPETTLLTRLGKPGNRKTYYKSNIRLSWFDAWEFCRAYDLHLASVESRVEQSHLQSALEQDTVRDWWLSGTDLGHEGKFVWMSSGKPISYTNWASAEPDNGEQNQHCMRLWDYGRKSAWDDFNCNELQNFICQLEN